MTLARHLFLSQLEKYIDQKYYRFKGTIPMSQETHYFSVKDLKHWPKLPLPWLNARECLLVAMAHAYIDVEKALLYLSEIPHKPDSSAYLEMGRLVEGIILFRESLRSDQPKTSWLRLARRLFLSLEQCDPELKELALLYATLSFAADDQLNMAIATLSKAAKVNHNPELYRMLSNIYACQKMFNVSRFYKNRFDRYKQSKKPQLALVS